MGTSGPTVTMPWWTRRIAGRSRKRVSELLATFRRRDEISSQCETRNIGWNENHRLVTNRPQRKIERGKGERMGRMRVDHGVDIRTGAHDFGVNQIFALTFPGTNQDGSMPIEKEDVTGRDLLEAESPCFHPQAATIRIPY